MKTTILQILCFVCLTSLAKPQQTKTKPMSAQEILSVLGQQPSPSAPKQVPVPVPFPEHVPPGKQPVLPPPTLHVEPLPPQPVSGADVMSSLQSACHALKMFISRSEHMQRYLSMMPPGLMPWLYAMKVGFPTECGFSSYSNALNVFSTACNVFETCPLPPPMMASNVTSVFEMPAQLLGGIGLPGVQMQQFPMQPFPTQQMPVPAVPVQAVPVQPVPVQPLPVQPVPIQPLPGQQVPVEPFPMQPVLTQPVPVKPRAQVLPAPSLPEIRPSRRKVQVQAQQIRIPQRPMTSGGQQNQPRVQVITKLVPRPPAKASRPPPKPVAVLEPQPPPAPKQTFQRMPMPSMGSVYPVWFYGFRQVPTVRNVGRSLQQKTTPRPGQAENDHSD